MKRYFKEIVDVIQSTRKGMALTWKHAWDARKQRTQHNIQDAGYFSQPTGIATLQYPHVEIPTPDNGRYQLHNEMDDCIVCDKCVKVCPVDCIDIEPIKATGLVGNASDGSPIRLYAAKFDIDMSKCCFCGLCTTVCPTECLTMTSEYDFSVFDVKEHNFSFANLTAEEAAEKKKLYEQFVAEKEAMKMSGQSSVGSGQSSVDSGQSSVGSGQLSVDSGQSSVDSGQSSVDSGQDLPLKAESESPASEVQRPASKLKPAFKPSFKAKAKDESPASDVQRLASEKSPASDVQRLASEKSPASEVQRPASKLKPAFKPAFKPKAKDEGLASENSPKSEVVSPELKKPTFKPSFKSKAVVSDQLSVDSGQDLPSKAEFESPASEVQRLASVKSLATEKSPASNIDNPEEK